MGIKHFFTWFNGEFSQHIKKFGKTSPPFEINIDTFMIDLNGVFHNSAQKIYKYGNFAVQRSILRPNRAVKTIKDSPALQKACFVDISNTIEELINVVRPKKRLILAIDGVAPLSKQNQQRQRRYRGAVEDPENFFKDEGFDSNSITPGTKFMDNLSRYLDWFIRKKINEESYYRNLEIVFSNEKVAGEGEHKLIDFIRKYGTDDETYCINALDADLVMLSLSTQKKNFYLLREDMYTEGVDYMYVNIGGGFREDLIKNVLYWEGADEKFLIYDFILICFLCGNDFLPNIPSISIMEKGLNTIIDMYRREKKHLVNLNENGQIFFIKENFGLFLNNLANCEKSLLIEKIKNKNLYIQDTILEKHYKTEDDKEIFLDFDSYRDEYYKSKNIINLKTICEDYLDGCQWVLTYYVNGISDWNYIYKYHYSPFAIDLAKYVGNYNFKPKEKTFPALPFEQLMCVLPPKNSNFLPQPLDKAFTTSLKNFCPVKFNINYEGKKKRWEGVVELPIVDFDIIRKVYRENEKYIDKIEMKRNIVGKCFRYSYDDSEFCQDLKSYYGIIKNCRVIIEVLN
jgi:5'-3' exonuclease